MGQPPFVSNNAEAKEPTHFKEQIITEEIPMKDYFSKDFESLLQGLCAKDVKRRMTLEQAKNHPFFKNVNWTDLVDKVAKAPLKTKVKTQFDSKNFDKDIMKQEIVSETENQSVVESAFDKNFHNFSFN